MAKRQLVTWQRCGAGPSTRHAVTFSRHGCAGARAKPVYASLRGVTPVDRQKEWPVREADYRTSNFRFALGETLPELRIHYATLGKPHRNAKGEIDNAVMVLHGTGGSGRQFLVPQFADELYGPGQPLNIRRYWIILPDGIGHGASSKPSDGLRMRFPRYEYTDMVEAQYRLLHDGRLARGAGEAAHRARRMAREQRISRGAVQCRRPDDDVCSARTSRNGCADRLPDAPGLQRQMSKASSLCPRPGSAHGAVSREDVVVAGVRPLDQRNEQRRRSIEKQIARNGAAQDGAVQLSRICSRAKFMKNSPNNRRK